MQINFSTRASQKTQRFENFLLIKRFICLCTPLCLLYCTTDYRSEHSNSVATSWSRRSYWAEFDVPDGNLILLENNLWYFYFVALKGFFLRIRWIPLMVQIWTRECQLSRIELWPKPILNIFRLNWNAEHQCMTSLMLLWLKTTDACAFAEVCMLL